MPGKEKRVPRHNRNGVERRAHESKYQSLIGTPIRKIPFCQTSLADLRKHFTSNSRGLKAQFRPDKTTLSNMYLIFRYRLDPKDPDSTRYKMLGPGSLKEIVRLIDQEMEEKYNNFQDSGVLMEEMDGGAVRHFFTHISRATLWCYPPSLGSGDGKTLLIPLTDIKDRNAGYTKTSLFIARFPKTRTRCLLQCFAWCQGISIKAAAHRFERSVFENVYEYVSSEVNLNEVNKSSLFYPGKLNYYREGNHVGLCVRCNQQVLDEIEPDNRKIFRTPDMGHKKTLIIAIDFEFDMIPPTNPDANYLLKASEPKIGCLEYRVVGADICGKLTFEEEDVLALIISNLKMLQAEYFDHQIFCYSANGRGVEHQYIVKELTKSLSQNFFITNIDGTKIKSFQLGGVYMIDSQLLFPGSLDAFCKSMGVLSKKPIAELMVQKGYWNDPTTFMRDNKWCTGPDEKIDIEVEYCLQDCTSLLDALQAFNSTMVEVHNNFGPKKINPHNQPTWLLGRPSLSSIASSILQHQYKIEMTPEHLCPVVQDSYFGGRTECFKIGETPGLIYATDINSSYPDVMREGITVNPKLLYKPNINELRKGRFLAKGTIFHDSKIGKIAVRSGDKVIFPVGTFSCYFWDHELDEEITVLDVEFAITFELDTTIKEPLEGLYKKRLEVGKNTPLGTCMKLFMNNLYGRFGMKPERQFMGLIVDYDDLGRQHKTMLKYYSASHDMRTLNEPCICVCSCGAPQENMAEDDDFDCLCPCNCTTVPVDIWKTRISKHVQVNNLFASRTTSLGRLNLWRKIKELSSLGCTILYCDTDSVYYQNLNPDYIIPQNMSGLGEWDHQVIYDFNLKTLKVYGYKDSNKKEVIHYKGVRDPKNLDEVQVSETWLRKDFDIYVVNLEKRSSFDYTKGNVTKDGTVIPFRFCST